MKSLDSLDLKGKRVLLRADLNVPAENHKVLDDTRITRLIPTINFLKSKEAKIILITHFGRPDGEFKPEFSIKFLREVLEEKFATTVLFYDDYNSALDISNNLAPGEILLLENLRFHSGEESNDANFAAQLAKLGDIYVNDAFSCSHRAHSSIAAITKLMPSYPGLLLKEEVTSLENTVNNAQKPNMAIVGGKKVSTKFPILENLSSQVDYLVIGGAMANTFLAAQGHNIGKSYYEVELLDDVRTFIKNCKCTLILPTDFVVATSSDNNFVDDRFASLEDIKVGEAILDIGEQSINQINEVLNSCKSVMWNGPLGMFEDKRFAKGTQNVAQHVAKLTENGQILSVAGGGDIVSALNQCGQASHFSYISTAGGAFLEWLEGKKLPGIEALL